jgi:hypothetical protein
LAGPRFHARHVPAFRGYAHGSYRPGTYGYGRSGFGFSGRGYGSHRYGHGFGFPAYGRRGYGSHGDGRYGYGYSGHGRGYGSHGYYGYGSYGRGFYSGSWLWPRADVTVIPVAAVGPTGGPHPYPDIPSVADLPVSVGIRSAPAASPTVFVLGAGRRSLRTGGAKIVSTQRSDADGDGPRIIRLDVPRGR